MTSEPIATAIETLQARFGELVAERQRVGRRLLEEAIRHQQIEKAIEGCVAGAQALGGDIQRTNALTAPAQVSYNAFVVARNSMGAQHAALKDFFGITSEEAEPSEAEAESDAADQRANMPRIADIIKDRLAIAGTSGVKAADIRAYILDAYDADIHDKTVSMTLNRLQKESVVRREGHIWFSVSVGEAENPGG